MTTYPTKIAFAMPVFAACWSVAGITVAAITSRSAPTAGPMTALRLHRLR